MKTTFLLAVVLLSASVAVAQTLAVTHNTWSAGAPMPTARVDPSVAVLKGQIYAVGGYNGGTLTNTEIYNPATNTWSAGVPLPTPLGDAAAAVVKNVLYVIGGTPDKQTPTNTVWAYNLKTKVWSSKAPMPTARISAAAVVEGNIIYVIGGWAGGNGLDTVESYNPATDTWTEETPLLAGKWAPSVGLIGTKLAGYTIVAADGAEGCCPSGFTGDSEGYNVSTNTWTSLNSDPTARAFACFGTIGAQFYVAGGNDSQGPALSVTESFKLSKNAWKTLASLPQPAIDPGSAVYKGRLYCIGGWNAWNGNYLNNVQIYQP